MNFEINCMASGEKKMLSRLGKKGEGVLRYLHP